MHVIKPARASSHHCRSRLQTLLPVTAAWCAAWGPAAAPAAEVSNVEPVEVIVVTGSRLRRAVDTPIPITVISRDDMKAQGAVSVDSVVRDLPSAAPARGAVTNNFGSGASQVDLRTLGEARTLVLLNGKRLVPSASGGTPDINAIPAVMIDRVEILTGGASAVYGSDAIAGVVNYVLREKLEGLETSFQYGANDEGDGHTYDASLVFGASLADGRGSIIGWTGYTRRDAVYRRDRSWAATELVSSGASLVPAFNNQIPEGRLPTTGPAGGLMFNANRELVPYDGRLYNAVQYQYLTIPQERYMLGVQAEYAHAPGVETYLFATFAQNHAARQTNEAVVNANVRVNYGNPLLSAQQRQTLFGSGTFGNNDTVTLALQRRLIENGAFQEDNRYTFFQMALGQRGTLGAHFGYDLSAQYGQTYWNQRIVGDSSLTRFQQGLLVNPNGTCIDPSGGCVPLDIFTSAPGAFTAEMANFIRLPEHATTRTEQRIVTGSISGDLGGIGARSPWADTPLQVALGAEYREDESTLDPDDNLRNGNNISFGRYAALSGENVVTEFFGELNLPILENKPFAQSLALSGSYRRFDYDLSGEGDAYGYGALWEPIAGFRLRGSFQRAVRAPTINNLFSEALPSSDSGIDPCFADGANPASALRDLCIATGVPAAAYDTPTFQCPSGRCTGLVGGNIALEPEISDTKTYGIVLQPAGSSFTATLDYFDITVDGAIRGFGASLQNVLDTCYGRAANQNPTQDPNNVFCRQVVRHTTGQIHNGGRASQPLGYVSRQLENIGFLSTTGFDAELYYDLDFGNSRLSAVPGSLRIALLATHVDSYEQQARPGEPVQDCAGTFGLICGQPIPAWRVNTRLTWLAADNVNVTARYRWLDSVTREVDEFTGTVADPAAHSIGAQSYVDLSAAWNVFGDVSVQAGVNNVLNNEPPLLPRVFGADVRALSNTFPGTYDLGRSYFVSITADF